jgi:hypothetical protein
MSEKKEIKSWRHQHVRIKKEYLKIETVRNGHYDDDDNWVDDENAPLVDEFQIVHGCPLTTLEAIGLAKKPETDVFKVWADVYGTDLYRHTFTPLEVGSVEPTHQIILEETRYPYMWDAKYFEVVRQEHIWVKDEEF